MEPDTPKHTGDNMPPASHDDLDEVQERMRSQEEDERRARIEYLRSIAGPRKSRHHWGRIVLIIIGVLLIGGAVFYWFILRDTGLQPKDEGRDTAQQQSGDDKEAEEQVATKHHESTNFTLGFDYPENWTVKDEGNGKLIVTSPAMQLRNARGDKTRGQIALTIQGKQNTLEAFKQGNAVAVRTSEKISYTKPTQNQRAQTYISFLSYASSKETGIDGVYITGDLGYQKDQAVPQVDVVRVDPLIMVAFWKCSGSECTEGAAFPIDTKSWSDTATPGSLIKPILSSLTIQ